MVSARLVSPCRTCGLLHLLCKQLTATNVRTLLAFQTGTRIATAPATITATSTVCAVFTDVQPGSTFYTYILCLSCRGVISGYSDGTFRPGDPITRGQIAKVL